MKLIRTHLRKPAQGGFTLIEMLVSVALFAVVMVSATVAVLAAIDANQKSQSLNSVMVNLDVALESMAREVRLGDDFTCIAGTNGNCSSIMFLSGLGPENNTPITYAFTSNPSGGYIITRTLGTGAAQTVTASEIDITNGYFQLYNASTMQTKIFVVVQGKVQVRQSTGSSFYIQTLMSRRATS